MQEVLDDQRSPIDPNDPITPDPTAPLVDPTCPQPPYQTPSSEPYVKPARRVTPRKAPLIPDH